MKFSQSQRSLHKPNYNPPCNVYQIRQGINQKTKILCNGLLQKNTFGYQTRFRDSKLVEPGPGKYLPVYNNKAQKNSFQNKISKPKNLIHKHQINVQSSPSIPFRYYGQIIDQQQKKYTQQLLKSEDPAKALLLLKKKQAGFTFSRDQRIKSHKNIQANPDEDKKQQIFNQQMSSTSNIAQKKTKVFWQERIKIANQRRLQMIQTYDQSFVPSLQLIEMIRKKKNRQNPGPGQYLGNQSQIVPINFQIYQNPKGAIFTSSQRFDKNQQSDIGPGSYNVNLKKSHQNFSFARETRKSLQKVQNSQNFRFYIDPNTQNIQQRNKKDRRRSFAFNSNTQRFPALIPNQNEDNFQQQQKMNRKLKLTKMINSKLKIKERNAAKQENGLLNVSTIASTVQ